MAHIVVGVDRSPAATAALAWALDESAVRGLEVHVVHAWLEPVNWMYAPPLPPFPTPEDVSAHAKQVAQELLRRVLATGHGTSSPVVVGAEQGAPAAVLSRLSADAQTVVVGTRGAGALSRAVLGSVSAAVLHHAHCPVAVVPVPQPGTGRPPRVIAGVDHSPAAQAALAWAADEASRRQAVLVPLLVREPAWMDDGSGHWSNEGLSRLDGSERAALAAAVPATATCAVEPQVLVGHPGGALIDFAEPQDLLVLGSRGRGGFTGLLLGSTSTSVAQHARCPVVVIRSAPGD